MSLRRCRVLLVDDEPRVRGATARLLGAEFEVIEAPNATHAIAVLALVVPDVVITDLSLGEGERGEDLLVAVRDTYPEVARIVISGSSSERIEALGDLVALVFRKGAFDPLVLVDAVRALYRGQSA